MLKHLVSEEEWTEAFPFMIELRKDLILQDFIEMLKQMTNEGYNLIAIYDDGKIVGFSILWKRNVVEDIALVSENISSQSFKVSDMPSSAISNTYLFGSSVL